jgi:hypothetical protein
VTQVYRKKFEVQSGYRRGTAGRCFLIVALFIPRSIHTSLRTFFRTSSSFPFSCNLRFLHVSTAARMAEEKWPARKVHACNTRIQSGTTDRMTGTADVPRLLCRERSHARALLLHNPLRRSDPPLRKCRSYPFSHRTFTFLTLAHRHEPVQAHLLGDGGSVK